MSVVASQGASSKGQIALSPRFDPRILKSDHPFRLGIFGGTFDPVHIGHLHIAQRALEQFALDGVLFIPTGRPAWKINTVSPVEDRYAMLKAAVEGNEHFDVSRLEIDREGITYTIDTLRTLKERYQDKAELFFIVGADTAAEIATWKDADEIRTLVTFLCARRTNSKDTVHDMLHNDRGFEIRFIESSLIDISSRELREWIRVGRSIHYLVPEVIYSFISERGLYKGT